MTLQLATTFSQLSLSHYLVLSALLFVIGLELSPQRLWVMRRQVFGTGLLQVLATSLVMGAAAYFLFGFTVNAAAIVGGSLALSSTAFGLQIQSMLFFTKKTNLRGCWWFDKSC